MITVQHPQEPTDAFAVLRHPDPSQPASYAFSNRLLAGSAGGSDSGHADRDWSDSPIRVFDRLAEGQMAFIVPDSSCWPLIRPGEIAVIDCNDRELDTGALYLRRIVSSNRSARLTIVELVSRPLRAAVEPGQSAPSNAVVFVAHNRPCDMDDWPSWSAQFGPIPMGDGPYLVGHEAPREPFDSIVGRVVGILRLGSANHDA